MADSHRCNIQHEKPDPKEHRGYDFIDMEFKNNQN